MTTTPIPNESKTLFVISDERLEILKMAPRNAEVPDVEDLCCSVENLKDQISDLKWQLAEAREALEQSELALNDWIHTYAPEFCDADDVARSKSRIWQCGTLAYIGRVLGAVRSALKSSNPDTDKP